MERDRRRPVSLLRIWAVVLLGLASVLLLGLLAWAISANLWAIYPRDTQDCPSGSERWGRIIGGQLVTRCFELHDQKGG